MKKSDIFWGSVAIATLLITLFIAIQPYAHLLNEITKYGVEK